MTDAEVAAKFKELVREAKGKARHIFHPTLIQKGYNGDALIFVVIRSDTGILFKWGKWRMARTPKGVKAVYQPYQRTAVNDRRGVEDWSFGKGML